ncbi:hypothetical protein EBB07_08680 [Paenibacillaceae bacterium]|nr:hypothetical protein EBB07_08680 [Paenibacillaceae bacterium]
MNGGRLTEASLHTLHEFKRPQVPLFATKTSKIDFHGQTFRYWHKNPPKNTVFARIAELVAAKTQFPLF